MLFRSWSSSHALVAILAFAGIPQGYSAARARLNGDLDPKSLIQAPPLDKKPSPLPHADAAEIYWPLQSPFPVTLSSPASTILNTSTQASLPTCNGRLFGKNLNLASCRQVLEGMSNYVGTKSFGQRGTTGYFEAPLPFRYLSHDGRCAIDVAHARGVTSDIVSPLDLKNAALAIIQVCVAITPNEGGLITGLGEGRGLSLRVVPYKPSVVCGPDGSGPPWITCRDFIDRMPTDSDKQVFGPHDDATTTIPIPWAHTSSRRRCAMFIDIGEPRRGVREVADW
ncbi:MAG: hypothetical protein Q9173_006322 [Seirophora scorigena]